MSASRIAQISIGLMTVLGASAAWAADGHPGKQLYQRCAACHLPDGAGVPGAFPPLRGSVASFAKTQDGRDYLTFVVLKGVSGKIEVGGHTYNGMMPSVTGGLSDAQISDLLNYLVSVVASEENADAEENAAGGDAQNVELENILFSPDEIKKRRDAVASQHTQQSILDLRVKALKVSVPPSGATEDG